MLVGSSSITYLLVRLVGTWWQVWLQLPHLLSVKTTQLLLHFCLLRLAQNHPGAQLIGSAERMEIWAVSSAKPSGHTEKPP